MTDTETGVDKKKREADLGWVWGKEKKDGGTITIFATSRGGPGEKKKKVSWSHHHPP